VVASLAQARRAPRAACCALRARPPAPRLTRRSPPRRQADADADDWLRTTLLRLSPGGGNRSPTSLGGSGSGGGLADFWSSKLPGKLVTLAALLIVSRVGVYIPLEGVDRAAFAAQIQSSGLLGYVDTLSGGSISKVGVFSLGIVPYINSSIIFQLLASAVPQLQRLQKEEGEAGRRQFAQYQRYGALGFALVQAVGQCLYLRPFVDDFSVGWLAASSLSLTAGAMVLVWLGETLTELKLGNGTSLLIFVNILSALPLSAGQTLKQASDAGNTAGLAAFGLAFLAITAGIVYVQEAERKIPIAYASRYAAASGLAKSSYLPFKVNSAGVMPIIFASSLLALPATLSRLTGSPALDGLVTALGPGGGAYLPVNVALIAFFNYFYTFLQLEPGDVADQLKKQGASIPGVRPGVATREYITGVLERLSLLGSAFLGTLAAAPALVEATTGLTTFRGFGGTSILILVGVATDSARKVASELVMTQYDRCARAALARAPVLRSSRRVRAGWTTCTARTRSASEPARAPCASWQTQRQAVHVLRRRLLPGSLVYRLSIISHCSASLPDHSSGAAALVHSSSLRGPTKAMRRRMRSSTTRLRASRGMHTTPLMCSLRSKAPSVPSSSDSTRGKRTPRAPGCGSAPGSSSSQSKVRRCVGVVPPPPAAPGVRRGGAGAEADTPRMEEVPAKVPTLARLRRATERAWKIASAPPAPLSSISSSGTLPGASLPSAPCQRA
jgi:protein transport protein SEC61 subunit alpha